MLCMSSVSHICPNSWRELSLEHAYAGVVFSLSIMICTRSLLTVSTHLHRRVIYLYVCFQSVSTFAHFQFNLFTVLRLAYLYPLPVGVPANPMRETLLPAGAGSFCWKAAVVSIQRCVRSIVSNNAFSLHHHF